MTRLKTAAIKAGLETLYFSGAHLLARPFLSGLGAILTMHRICPKERGGFHPNDLLAVTPDYLEEVITGLKRAAIDIVDLDEAVDRLRHPDAKARFVVLTFDDGYRDNRQAGWHVLKRMKVPFTLYIPTAFPEGRGRLWWIALERIIARSQTILVEIDGRRHLLQTVRQAEKNNAFIFLHGWLRGLSNADQEREIVDLCSRYGIDLEALCRELIMDWNEIGEMAADPRATIGAHTVSHPALSKLSETEARFEMRESARVIESVLGTRPRHLSFPYGWTDAAGGREFRLAREEGFTTAVTTRPGLLYARHAEQLTALPRLSLNGRFQTKRYLDVLMSGLPTYIYNRFERCPAA